MPDPFDGGAHRLPEMIQPGVLLLAQTDQHDPLGGSLPGGVQQGALIDLPREFPGLQELRQAPLERPVHDRRVLLEGPVVFVMGQDQRVRRLPLDIAVLDLHIHG